MEANYVRFKQGARRQHVVLPPEVTGYAFDPERSWWSTVVAEESTNLIINPSFERINDVGFADEYTSFGTFNELGEENIIIQHPEVGSVAGRRAAVLVAPPGAGWLAYDAGIAVTPGQYTFSMHLKCTEFPVAARLTVRDGGTEIARRTVIIPNAQWNRVEMTYRETGTGTRVLRLEHTNATSSAYIFHTDGWQFERKPYATTYLDGDMVGFSDSNPYTSYFWHGQPHASPSTRRAHTGSGGRVVSWSDEADFLTTSIVGLMMPPIEQRSQTLGNRKQVHTGVDVQTRDFTITGRIFANNPERLLRCHNALTKLHRPNNTSKGDQLLLRYQMIGDNGMPVGLMLEIPCVYSDGLQGSISSFYQESLALQFRAVQPALVETTETSVALDLVKELVTNQIAYRDDAGEFFNLGTGSTTGVAHRVGFLADGRIVAFGPFSQIAGTTADAGAIWDGDSWTEIADVPLGTISDIDDGFKLGYPLTVAAGNDIHEWDATTETWTQLGDGMDGPIFSMQRDENGDIWVGGDFEFADDGITLHNNVAKWNATTAAWERVGQGLIDPDDLNPETLAVHAVLAPNDGNVYFAGTFEEGTNLSGSVTASANAVIYWDIAAQVYRGMGNGFNAAPNALIQGRDGYIYATGPFDQDGTESYDIRGFARWNGYSWEEVFPIIRPGGVFGADHMIQDEDGIIWFHATNIIDSDDLFEIDGLGRVAFFGWRNGIFYPPYMADTGIIHMAIGPGNRAIHVTDNYDAFDSHKAPAMNRVTYEGAADAPVVVHIHGPGRIHQVHNLSTEGGVYGRDNFTVSAHEDITIRADTQRTMFYSNQKTNLYGRILAGETNVAALRLIPGENRISILVTGGDEDNSAAWLTWRNRYWGLVEALP